MKQIVIILAIIVLCFHAQAQSRWLFELQGAEVYNVPLPLNIRQQGYPDIKLTGARYHTEPFTLPVYYDGRLSRWQDDQSWEIEFIHHKIYLQNRPDEVKKFNISHGYNFLFINRGFDRHILRYRVGAGVVIAHPESEVRGLSFGSSTDDNDWGYYLAGPAVHASVNKPFYIGDWFFINAEARTTFGYASVKVARGRADVYNLAFHLVLGVGVEVKK